MAIKNLLLHIRSEIVKLGDTLSNAGLIIEMNYPHTYRLGGGIAVLSWDNYGVSESVEFASVEEYMQFLENRQYVFILFDGSLVQLVYQFRGKRIVGHHLGYFPSPVPIQPEELREYFAYGLTLTDLVNDKLQQDTFRSNLRLRSPIRFDFDIEDNREDHPASHLHISQSDCRIAVVAPLSIGHFLCFLFRHFYPEHWREHECIRRWPHTKLDRTIMPEQTRHLHLSCTR